MDTTLAHRNDPDTSHVAAANLNANDRATLKDALLQLLAEQPRTADEVTQAYVNVAELNGWPVFLDWHNIKRRLSELHAQHGVIRDSGYRRASRLGRASVVWELRVPLEQARIQVRAGL